MESTCMTGPLESRDPSQERPEEAFYERFWHLYRDRLALGDPTSGARWRLLASTLSQHRVRSVLDAGCGDGWFTSELHKRGFEVVGMDISGSALEVACRRFPHLALQRYPLDRRGWPFRTGQFDAVFASEVVEHIYDVGTMFAEMNRVLRPGGLVIITTPYHGLIKNLFIVLFGFERHFNVEGGHIRFFTVRSCHAVLEKYGFEVIKIRYYGRIRPISKGMFIVAVKKRDVDHPFGSLDRYDES